MSTSSPLDGESDFIQKLNLLLGGSGKSAIAIVPICPSRWPRDRHASRRFRPVCNAIPKTASKIKRAPQAELGTLADFRNGPPMGSGKHGQALRKLPAAIPKVSPQLHFGIGAPMMVINPSRHEPDHEPLLDVELAAEVGRLTAGPEGESPIERIYRECDGPVSRRKAILQLSSDRLGACIQRHVRKGATELTVVAMDSEVTLEVAYAPRVDWLRDGPVAQRKITFPLLRAERGSDKAIPNGTAEGSW